MPPAAPQPEGLVLVTADNATGFKGVSLNGGGFQARATEGGDRIFLGHFSTLEAAALAYARHA
eukprot:4673410-Prymnesium_polylepis.1